VHVPRGARRRREASEELFAARPSFDRPLPLWTALADEVAAGDLRGCVSDELFGKALGRTVRKVVDDLGGKRAHVLAVARRYDACLPSQWQEPSRGKHDVWTAHDTAAMVRCWARHVVADEADREQLPRVFEELFGLPVGLFVTDPTRSNQSLAFADVELMRAVNAALARCASRRTTTGARSTPPVADAVAGSPRPAGPRAPTMPDWPVERVRALSAARVEAVGCLGVHLIGSPNAYGTSKPTPRPRPDRSRSPTTSSRTW
jgi:hypothetical protein